MTDDDMLDAKLGIPGAREAAAAQLTAILADPGEPLDLRVTHRDGHWSVRMENPEDGTGPAYGTGSSFAEAWHMIAPAWAKGCNDNGREG